MEGDEGIRGGAESSERSSIGPVLPPHVAASLSSSSKPAIGPSLPPHLQRQNLDTSVAAPPKRVLGPTMPPTQGEGEAADEPKLSAAAQAFLDREKRMKEAAERKAAGLDSIETETNNRPEWMLAPPTSKSFSEVIQKDQSAALKNRGFSQAQNIRVQKGKGGSGLGGTGEDDHSLWTETPAERAKRLMEEEMGIRPKGGETGPIETEEQLERRKADELREEQIRKAIAEHSASRGPSLLEQHQAKRRSEMRSKDKKSSDAKDGRGDGSSSRRKSGSESDSSTDRDRVRHARKHPRHDERNDRDKHRRRDRSESDNDSDSERRSRKERRRSRHDDDGIKRSSKEERDRPRHHHHHHRSHRTESEERERDKRKREKEKEREKREKRKQREKEEKGEKKGAPMMVWDRDAAMSVAGKLMDDQKRMATIKSASSLGSRFGGGSSRYL